MIDALSNFHFIRPGWLLLIPVSVFVWWTWKSYSDQLRGWRLQMDDDILSALTVGRDRGTDRAMYGVLAAWCLAALAVAGPSWKLEPSPFASDAPPLLIVLKSNDKMTPPGMSPSYMERAKLKIADIAQARKGQPLGLMVYAGSAHLVLPPTKDTEVVVQMTQEISPGIMPAQGDDLSSAISQANDLLSRGDSGGNILLLANGFDQDPSTLAPLRDSTNRFPIQILMLENEIGTPTKSLESAGDLLGAPLIPVRTDDQDVDTIIKRANQATASTVSGESPRWHEAGYWLTPTLAILVLSGFRRRETRIDPEVEP